MGFISDVKSFASNAAQKVSSTVTQAKEAVTQKVEVVKEKAAQGLTKAQEEISGARSSFDNVKKTVEKAVSSGGVKAEINVGDLKKANPGTLAGLDEEGIAKDLSGKIMKNPADVTKAIGELPSSDRDDVSEELAKSLTDAQLKELAGTPDGRGALNKMRYELDEGPTWPGEQKQIDRIDKALKEVPAQKPAETAKPAEPPKVDPAKASATGAEYDPTKPKVDDSTPLPQNGQEILSNMSQLNGGNVEAGNERCGATSLIAGAIAKNGPQGAADLARSLAAEAKKNKKPDQAKIYTQIATNLSDPKTATYGELGRLAKTIHNDKSQGADALSAQQIAAANKAVGNDIPGFVQEKQIVAKDGSHPIAESYGNVDKMDKGQSWPAKIAVNGSKEGNHWVQMGKDKDGRVFVYDPMPKKGEPQIIYRDQDEASRIKFAAYQNAMLPGNTTTKGWADPG